jgi:protein phosphatase
MNVGGWGAVTDRGRIREVNEDSLLADPPLFAVADGMGGHAAGDAASSMAIEAVSDLVGHGPVNVGEMVEAISAANTAILNAGSNNPEQLGMGTTLSGLTSVIAGGSEHWLVFNVGDSRVYRMCDGQLIQLTVDHSEAEEMVLAGRLAREEVRNYRRRNVVTRSLGTEPAPVPDSWVFPPLEGERFLVCSDGLTSELTDDQIRDSLLENSDPQLAAEDLLRLALGAGGRDNVTVIVVDGTVRSNYSDLNEDTAPRVKNG